MTGLTAHIGKDKETPSDNYRMLLSSSFKLLADGIKTTSGTKKEDHRSTQKI